MTVQGEKHGVVGSKEAMPRRTAVRAWQTRLRFAHQWVVTDPDNAERAALEVLAARAEPTVTSGGAGRIWRAAVEHERTSWGCVSSEVRVVAPVGEAAHLHVAAEECSAHPGDPGQPLHGFGSAVAHALDVRRSGASPFVVGHTTTATVEGLVRRLRDPRRTAPIVLLSGSTMSPHAPVLLSRATGGALVATIDGDASWALSHQLGRSLGCYAGAVRVYPPFTDGTPECPAWVSRRVAQQGWESVANQVLATVSVHASTARRVPLEEVLEREATATALESATATIAELRAQVVEGGSRTTAADTGIDALFDAQNEQIAELERQLENEQLTNLDLLDQLEAAERANEGLRVALQHSRWDGSPDETAGAVAVVDKSVEAAIQRLADPGGALVCTENALRVWRSASYPDPDRMLDALRRLEQAAEAWRAADAKIGGRLGSWLQDLTGLRFAGSDHGLERADLDTFELDGRVMSRVPHIKVDDAKHSNQVGRIYFATDADNLRWVVDHVGQKLYGR